MECGRGQECYQDQLGGCHSAPGEKESQPGLHSWVEIMDALILGVYFEGPANRTR